MVPGHSRLDSLEAKGSTFVKEANNRTTGMLQRDVFPNVNLKKLTSNAQQLALEKEKQYWKSNNCWFDKKSELWFGPNNNLALPEILKSPLVAPGRRVFLA